MHERGYRQCACGCGEPVTHPTRRYAYGHLSQTVGTDATRFWGRVTRAGPGDCWEWQGKRIEHGYGVFFLDVLRGEVMAYRYAWERLRGAIPEGLVIDHLCRNPSCVNPDHLEPVTNAENTRRGLQGRMVTQCPRGHAYDEENTYVRPNGQRKCRACNREKERERKLALA